MALRTKPAVRVRSTSPSSGYMLFLGFPLFCLLMASLKTTQQLASLDVWILPRTLHWANFTEALATQGIIRSTLNSLIVSLATTIIVTVIAVPAAYAMARFRGKLRLGRYRLDPGQPGVPGDPDHHPAVLDPANDQPERHAARTDARLHDLLPALRVVDAAGLRRGHPGELEEAAAMDGASRFTMLRLVVFPLLIPGTVATAMFTFVSAWNEFFFALVLLQSPENFTLSLTLALFVGAEGQVRLGPLAAGAVLATIPSFIFFAILQRRLTGGLLSGAVKG